KGDKQGVVGEGRRIAEPARGEGEIAPEEAGARRGSALSPLVEVAADQPAAMHRLVGNPGGDIVTGPGRLPAELPAVEEGQLPLQAKGRIALPQQHHAAGSPVVAELASDPLQRLLPG